MATIDPTKDIKPILKTDWTAKQANAPFYQQAEGDLPARYSVSVTTDAETTNGSDLELDNIKNSALPTGFESIVGFYEKVDTDPSKQQSAFAEDWYVSERPGSKIKVLVSIPANIIDALEDIPEPEFLPTPWKEIYINTFDFETKVNGTIELLKKYELDIKRFQGKVQGINLNHEIQDLDNTIQVLAGLLQSNAINYDPTRSDLINLGINDNYQFLYGQINDGTGFKNLYKGFNTFKDSSPSKNKRTVNFLLNLDQTYEIYNKNEQTKFQEFFDAYVLDPPRYEFSVLPKASIPSGPEDTGNKVISGDNDKPRKSQKEVEDFVAVSDTQEQRDGALRTLETTANFVGDTAVAGIQEVNDWITLGTSYLTRNPGTYLSDGMYQRLLNKIPLQDLIRGALECLGFPGFEFINLAQAYLNTANSFLNNVAALINRTIPKLSIPDNFPIADYMADLGKKIFWSVLEAVQAALIQMLVELLQSFLNACKECALTNVESGKGRFDGLNFFSGDFLATSFASSFASGVEQGVRTATGTTFLANEAVAEARQSALNPVLINNSANQSELANSFGGTTPEEYARRLDAAKVEFNDYIATAGQIITPAEAGNLLLGCQVGSEPVDALTNLANRFPNIRWAFGQNGGDVTPAQIRGIWEDLGKIIGDIPILDAVKNATDAIPIEFQCLCDADDTRLRETLLKNKGLSDSQIKDQIDKSIARRNQRLEDLANALEKGNVLDGMIPPIYCTVIFKDSNGVEVPVQEVVEIPGEVDVEYRSKKTGQPLTKTVQKGMIEKDHPTVTFLIDQVLETVYDAVEMAFNEDISGFVSTLSKDTVNQREIPRTISAKRTDGTNEFTINPEWLKLVKDPQQNYSWGPLPGDAAQPGTTIIDPTESDIQTQNRVSEDSILGTDYARAYSAGQMQSGQTQPTAEQVVLWEAENIFQGTGGRKRPTDYSRTPRETQQRRYSEIYGYSPIPVTIREKGPKEFAPGLQNSYTRICSEERLFSISDNSDESPSYHVYNFLLENSLFQFAGLGEDIKRLLSPKSSDVQEFPTTEANSAASSQGLDIVTEALRVLSGSDYNIRYIVPFSSSIGNEKYPKETYGITISLTSPPAGSVVVPSFTIYQDIKSKDLTPNQAPPNYVLSQNDLRYDPNSPYIPQEQYFSSVMAYSVKWGSKIYSRQESNLIEKRSPNNFQVPTIFSYKQKTLDNDYYDELWRDYFCSFTKAVSESPFLQLDKLGKLNFTPTVKQGEDVLCDPSILDVVNLKQRIKDEYGLIQCIESAFPNIDGLGSNKDNPFEKANLSGAVLVLIRTYVIEVLMRTLFIFYYFKFTSPNSIDDILVSYVSSFIKGQTEKRGFIEEFTTETIGLYNRTVEGLPNPLPKTTDFDVALNYFIRYQIFSVANKITKTFNIVGDTSVLSYLMDDQLGEPAWIPTVNINTPLLGAGFLTGTRTLSDQLKPPENIILPVRPGLVRQLVGNGTLSANTMQKFDSNSEINIVDNLPIGQLFREYFGKNNFNIWSKEGSITGTPYNPTSWPPITGRDPVSPTKKGSLREYRILNLSGLLESNSSNLPSSSPITWSDKLVDAFNIGQDTNSKLVPGTQYHANSISNVEILNETSTEEEAYEFGVSYVEKLAMQKILALVTSAAQKNLTYTNTPAEFQSLIDDYKYTDNNDTYYPGKILKIFSEKYKGSTLPLSFKYGDVWDTSAWPNNTGTQNPDWFMKTYGEQDISSGYWYPNNNYLSSQFGSSLLNNIISISTFNNVSNPLDFALRNSQFAIDLFAGRASNPYPSQSPLFTTWLPVTAKYKASVGTGNDWYLPERRSSGGFRVSEDGAAYLRWITVGGYTIGPWKGFRTSPANDEVSHLKWKLIDPGYDYTEPGGQKTSNSNIGFYNGRNDPFKVGDGINTYPSRSDFTRGFTIGVDLSNPSVVGINPNTGNKYASNLWTRAKNLSFTNMDYISLIDFDLYSIRQIIDWEKDQLNQAVRNGVEIDDLYNTQLGQVQRQKTWDPYLVAELNAKYIRWRDSIQDIIDLLELATPSREIIAQDFTEEIATRGIGRESLPEAANPGQSFGNGNFIKEIYIRAEEHDHQGASESEISRIIQQRFSGAQAYQEDVQRAYWANSNFVDREGRTEYMKDVINITDFQNYLNSRFINGNPDTSNINNVSCHPRPLSEALIRDIALFEECGEAQAAELGLSVTPDRNEFYLGDFFKSVRLGMRLSYVEPIPQNSDGTNKQDSNYTDYLLSNGNLATQTQDVDPSVCHRDQSSDPTKQFFEGLVQVDSEQDYWDNASSNGINKATSAALYDKSFYVPNGNNIARVIPIVCSEIEIDPITKMGDITNTGNKYTKTDSSGQTIPIGFFENEFANKSRDLKNQLTETQEFKTIFNYMFPLERMLSLNNIYGSEYLRSFKGIPELFDPTKTRIADLFFVFYNSGNYQAAAKCVPSNKDLQTNMMNGIPWEGIAATLALMIAKTVVLIFKGFVEAFDVNIIVSKTIKDSIRVINQLVAQGLTLANQTQQLGAALGDIDFSGTGGDPCKGTSANVPKPPPDAWFDPVPQNFIPEPQIMFISLALLPITLLPLLWPGLPITPFGLAYWFLDAKPYDPVPGPNWLNAMPPADFLDQLFNRADEASQIGSEFNDVNSDCNIDAGLLPPGSGGNNGE